MLFWQLLTSNGFLPNPFLSRLLCICNKENWIQSLFAQFKMLQNNYLVLYHTKIGQSDNQTVKRWHQTILFLFGTNCDTSSNQYLYYKFLKVILIEIHYFQRKNIWIYHCHGKLVSTVVLERKKKKNKVVPYSFDEC